MSEESGLSVAGRINQLLDHLGIEKAHFAARFAPDWTGFVSASAERVSSLVLVCPWAIDVGIAGALGSRLSVISGDKGQNSQRLIRSLDGLPESSLITIQDYEGVQGWADVMADLTDWIVPQISRVLGRADPQPKHVSVPSQQEGEIAGISYRIQGTGTPLILLPLSLSPSQWEPVLPQLSQQFCTITLGREHLGFVSTLESRGRSDGYLRVVRSLVEECELRPGDSIVEVGSGTGVLTRWLARRTRNANKITGVDISPYLIREAEALLLKEGLDDAIEFRQGNAESLPFGDATFDVTISSTVMEEVNADKMMAELVRITKPGGRIAVAVRAEDVPHVVSLKMGPELRMKADAVRGPMADDGCADVGLYQRFQEAGLVDLRMFPMLGLFPGDLLRLPMGILEATLDPDEATEWHQLVARAEAAGTFFVAQPLPLRRRNEIPLTPGKASSRQQRKEQHRLTVAPPCFNLSDWSEHRRGNA